MDQVPNPAFIVRSTCGDWMVAFDGASSTDPDGAVVEWRWQFGDGGQATGRQVEHDYGGPGRYHVELWAFDDRGNEARATQDISLVSCPRLDLAPQEVTVNPGEAVHGCMVAVGGRPPYTFMAVVPAGGPSQASDMTIGRETGCLDLIAAAAGTRCLMVAATDGLERDEACFTVNVRTLAPAPSPPPPAEGPVSLDQGQPPAGDRAREAVVDIETSAASTPPAEQTNEQSADGESIGPWLIGALAVAVPFCFAVMLWRRRSRRES